jgi:hypothetical protein
VNVVTAIWEEYTDINVSEFEIKGGVKEAVRRRLKNSLKRSDNSHCLLLKTRCFGDYILFLSSGETYLDGPNRKSKFLSPDFSQRLTLLGPTK